jgi:hypothetical protein
MTSPLLAVLGDLDPVPIQAHNTPAAPSGDADDWSGSIPLWNKL